MSANVTASFKYQSDPQGNPIKASVTIVFMADRQFAAKDREKNPIPGKFIWRYVVLYEGVEYNWWVEQEEHEFILKAGVKKGSSIVLYQTPRKNEKGQFYGVNTMEFNGFTFMRGQRPEEVLGGHAASPAPATTAPTANAQPASNVHTVPEADGEPDDVGLMVECLNKAAKVYATEKVTDLFAYFAIVVGEKELREDLRTMAFTFFIEAQRRGIRVPTDSRFLSSNLLLLNEPPAPPIDPDKIPF